MYLTYQYRLSPSKSQHALLARVLEEQRQLYNAALQERIDAYRRVKLQIGKLDQYRSIKYLREFYTGPVTCARWTISRVDDAYQAFFKRKKARKSGGFPRYRAFARWRSFGFAEMSGVRLIDGRLHIHGLPPIDVRLHRPLPEDGVIKSCVVSHDTKGWCVNFQIEIPDRQGPIAPPAIGIDVGLNTFLATNEGDYVGNPRIGRKAEREMARLNRRLARAQRGSKRREKVCARLARAHARVANARKTFLHQISASLIRRGGVAVEKLNIKGLARTRMAKSIHDAAWGRFMSFLRYKAERAGRAYVEVDPRYTTQTCSGCGVIPEIKLTLDDRVRDCDECGLSLCRDINAAKNILHRAVVRPADAKTAH